MGNDLSIWTLVLDARRHRSGRDAVAHVASVASWAVIFKKGRVIAYQASGRSVRDGILVGRRFDRALPQHRNQGARGHGEQSIFESGFGNSAGCGSSARRRICCSGARRAMRVAQMREMDRLERNLAMLATVGSTSLMWAFSAGAGAS
jgi:biopolymer transport protein TolQ